MPTMTETITDVANWAQPDAPYGKPAREQIGTPGASQLADWIIEDANLSGRPKSPARRATRRPARWRRRSKRWPSWYGGPASRPR